MRGKNVIHAEIPSLSQPQMRGYFPRHPFWGASSRSRRKSEIWIQTASSGAWECPSFANRRSDSRSDCSRTPTDFAWSKNGKDEENYTKYSFLFREEDILQEEFSSDVFLPWLVWFHGPFCSSSSAPPPGLWRFGQWHSQRVGHPTKQV